MAVSNRPWSGAASRFPDTAAYCRSALIDTNPPGQPKTQANCHLPVREPNGDVNKNAVAAAAAALAGARGGLKGVSSSDKSKAARALVRLYGQCQMTPPDSLRRMAGMGSGS